MQVIGLALWVLALWVALSGLAIWLWRIFDRYLESTETP